MTTPTHDSLAAALAIADNCNPPDRTIDEQRDISVAIKTLAAAVRKGLDYEHHSSCGHVWTMRHTACPECFAALKADLAAAVRDLQQNDVRGMNVIEAAVRSAPISDYIDHWEGRCLKAEAELDALKEKVCDTCQHRFVGMAPTGRPHFTYCKLTKVPVPELGTQTYVMCVVMGNTCGAWAAKEPTP
jgi:hypothetical protein